MTPTHLAEVLTLLDLEDHGEESDGVAFVAQHSLIAQETGHVFGGLVAAQATIAACRTVAGATDGTRPIHSLHAYFLRPGRPTTPIELAVETTRDGRAFSHRRVSARQDGRAIMEMACSFATPEPGLAHQTPMPGVPGPDELRPDGETVAQAFGANVITDGPFDVRSAEQHSLVARESGARTDRTRLWMRATGPVPEDDAVHAALLVYASDMMVLDPTTRPHALSMLAGDVRPTTIDHAVWFHAPVRVDGWLLHDLDSPWAGAGRGYARGRVFTRDDTLIAEIAQEGLIRSRPAR